MTDASTREAGPVSTNGAIQVTPTPSEALHGPRGGHATS
jgi:hypothetical protein